MNEEYLWDRTGETDEEIKELEQLLSELKYRPQPLDIPVGVAVGRKRLTFRALAIAATIAMLLLGAGIWRSRQGSVEIQAVDSARVSPVVQSLNQATPATADPSREELPPAFSSNTSNRRRSVGTTRAIRSRVAMHAAPTANEVAEGLAAKQQLMLALRVASAKLTVAQKRTLGATNTNQIHNQHKIG